MFVAFMMMKKPYFTVWMSASTSVNSALAHTKPTAVIISKICWPLNLMIGAI